MISRSSIIILILGCWILVSCDPARVYEENTEIPESIWDSSYKVPFNITIEDTTIPYNFYVNVRNAGGYPYRNLYLFVDTRFPDGKMINDTLECILADPSGRWLGEGLGDIWDNRIPLKKNVRFPMKGTYSFTIAHAMRVKDLPFIMDIGLRLEKNIAK